VRRGNLASLTDGERQMPCCVTLIKHRRLAPHEQCLVAFCPYKATHIGNAQERVRTEEPRQLGSSTVCPRRCGARPHFTQSANGVRIIRRGDLQAPSAVTSVHAGDYPLAASAATAYSLAVPLSPSN
jgi:hypothetical protein